MRETLHIFAAMAAVLLAGCSFDARQCTGDESCPEGFGCDRNTGICETLDRLADAGDEDVSSSPDAADAPEDANAPDDADTPSPDVSAPEDTRPQPDVAPADTGPAPNACLADPFESTCDDDSAEPNDEWRDAETIVGSRAGCPTAADRLVDFDVTLSPTLCAHDRGDWFKWTVVACETRSFIVEMTFTPQQACDPAIYDILIRGTRSEPDCDHPDWNCEALDDGGFRISYLVDPSSADVLQQHYLGVVPAEVDLNDSPEFDYELRVRIR